MRICFLSPVGVVGGAEQVLLAWVAAVRAWDPPADVTAVLLADGPLQERLRALGAEIRVVTPPSALASAGDTSLKSGSSPLPALLRLASACPSSLQFRSRLRDTLLSLQPDLVHSNGLKTHLLAAIAAPSKTPVVWHLHDFYSERPVAKWALKFARRGASHGVAISDAVQRDVASLLPSFPITTVRNTVDTDHFSPCLFDPFKLDELAGLPPASAGTVRVGLVSTYANWKGHCVFLDALAELPRDLPIRGYVVGGPIYATAGSQVSRAELEQRAAAGGLTGRVGFVPFQPDPVRVYRSLDIVVHASTRPEPFGLTIAEAMSCGRAVIVASAGGAKELFTDGIDAIGHLPGDVEDLANAIKRLVADTSIRASLGRNARETAVRSFSSSGLNGQIRDLYHHFCSR